MTAGAGGNRFLARAVPGVVYLAPKPAALFIAFTQAVVERWPEHQPYGGAYEEIIPHLTVAYRRPCRADWPGDCP